MYSPEPSQPRIFLVGYARGFRVELADAFREQGFVITAFDNPALVATALGFECPNAIIMNWIPASPLTSLEFIKRYGGVVPTIILSSHNVLMDVVTSLRAGAADYIRTPCHLPEILARVERTQSPVPTGRRVTVAGMTLEVETGVAQIGDETAHLTQREARLLSALMRCPERAVSREALLRCTGVTDAQPTIIESYIKKLRQRHPLLRTAIHTKYGQGYYFLPEQN